MKPTIVFLFMVLISVFVFGAEPTSSDLLSVRLKDKECEPLLADAIKALDAKNLEIKNLQLTIMEKDLEIQKLKTKKSARP